MAFFQHFITIFIESAPWLLLGYFVAGLIKGLIPTDFLHRHLGGSDSKTVIKAALLGAPLPLCSCGVIPAAMGLRRAGASKASTTTFLIATPETGVDSVSVTYALLGPFMAIIRFIVAVATAILAGLAVMKWGEANTSSPASAVQADSGCAEHSDAAKHTDTQNTDMHCCHSSSHHASSGHPIQEETSACCSSKVSAAVDSCCEGQAEPASGLFSQAKSGLVFTFIDLVKDTSLWLLIGFIVAAVIMTVIPTAFLAQWGATPYAYLLMAVIGVPMYICATSSTPIAVSLLVAGVSPGAILIFLLVGPATNIATLSMVRQELGKRVLSIYLGVIVATSFVFAWLTDGLVDYFSIETNQLSGHQHGYSAVGIISAIILALLLGNGLWARLRK